MKNRKSICAILFTVCVLLLSACSSSKFVNSMDDEKIASESPEVQRRVSIRMQLAVDYYKEGQFKPALEEIRNVITISPKFVDAYSLRALIQMEMNDPQRAEENFLYALKLDPANSEIRNNYAWFLCQNGREKQALPLYDKIVADRSYPTPLKAMMSAGVCSLRMKDIRSAERYFLMAHEVQPTDPSVNANLAKVYYDRAEYERARPYIQKVLKEEIYAADVLWLAIKIDQKLGDQASVSGLGTQLRRRHPNSKEFALFQKGAFNE
ncbi:type IV pilus biogenesis/stability protein PilW [Undibacterium fentianense]|uniref:Type IV pilus biogenesis/stability protein PilW n=1 Tax=Undibacterium fentianense TaxID=2828728 RepID=A0A941E1C4_9BURK|nr:type IV pilus biogenesis/stability protein PilW [Undibacterium fentianense]MBR7798839.1 type IV pilus biogenesis/stability protein PilW [Undibacterium fentianense]